MTKKLMLLVSTGLLAVGAFGAQQTINIGSTNNDGTGDPLRTAFQKANSNFTDLYAQITLAEGGTNLAPTNSVNGTGLSFSNGVIQVWSNNVKVAEITTNGHVAVSLSGTNPVSIHTIGNLLSGIAFGLGGSNNTSVTWGGTNVATFGSNGLTGQVTLTGASSSSSTNGYTPSWTISGTNGNAWLQVVGNTAQFQQMQIGDTIIVGNWQVLITGYTNGNQTLAISAVVNTNWTAQPFQWFVNPLSLNDSIPRRTGGMTGGPGFMVANYSIGNNGGTPGGYYFLDGITSSSIINTGGSPPFLGFNVGFPQGGSHGNQFLIQVGCQYNDLMVLSYDDIGIRGGITNWALPYIPMRQSVQAPNFTSYSYTIQSTNFIPIGWLGATNGNYWLRVTNTSFAAINIGDYISFNNSGARVTGKTNSNNTLAVYPQINSGSYTGGASNFPASAVSFDTTGAAQGSISGDGTVTINNGVNGNSGCLIFADGQYSTVMKNTGASPPYFSISAGVGYGGSFANQFIIQNGSTYNALIIYSGNSVGIWSDLTNNQGGALVMDNALTCKSNVTAPTITVTGPPTFSHTNTSPGNTTTPILWIDVTNGASVYKMPLYQ